MSGWLRGLDKERQALAIRINTAHAVAHCYSRLGLGSWLHKAAGIITALLPSLAGMLSGF